MKQNCRAVTFPRKRTNLFFFPDDLEILETWILISSFKYFRVVRIEKQICLFVFWENQRLDNLVSRSTDLYLKREEDILASSLLDLKQPQNTFTVIQSLACPIKRSQQAKYIFSQNWCNLFWHFHTTKDQVCPKYANFCNWFLNTC